MSHSDITLWMGLRLWIWFWRNIVCHQRGAKQRATRIVVELPNTTDKISHWQRLQIDLGFGVSLTLGKVSHWAWFHIEHGFTLSMGSHWAYFHTEHGFTLGMDSHWAWFHIKHGFTLSMGSHRGRSHTDEILKLIRITKGNTTETFSNL